MIDPKDIVEGFYWGRWAKSEDKLLITVYGQSPFLRIDIWEPGFGKTGVHVDNIDITRKPIEFIEEIKGLK